MASEHGRVTRVVPENFQPVYEECLGEARKAWGDSLSIAFGVAKVWTETEDTYGHMVYEANSLAEAEYILDRIYPPFTFNWEGIGYVYGFIFHIQTGMVCEEIA